MTQEEATKWYASYQGPYDPYSTEYLSSLTASDSFDSFNPNRGWVTP